MASELIEKIRKYVSIYEVENSLGGDSSRLRHNPCRAPYREDKKPSLSIYDNGHRWKDWANPELGGDVIAYYATRAGIPYEEALDKIARYGGFNHTDRIKPHHTPMESLLKLGKELPIAPALPDGVLWFEEGRKHLLGNDNLQKEIAQWRGWAQGFVTELAEQSWISAPLYYGQRTIAFPVQAPMDTAWGFSTIVAGFHLLTPPWEEKKWRFYSGDPKDKTKIPPLPLIMGSLDKRQKVVIMEGQWDALSLAYALGFFDSDTSWNHNYVIVGLRGVGSWKTFLKYYKPFINPQSSCVLIPDSDPAGRSWIQTDNGPSFFDELSKVFKSVKPLSFNGAKDFNEWLKSNPNNLKNLQEAFYGYTK